MSLKYALPCAALLAACAADPTPEVTEATRATTLAVRRVVLAGDLAHYTLTVRVGDAPNARVRLHRVVRERAPFLPRATRGGVMLLHGDFSTFATNFLPGPGGLAPYLAARDLDVWGIDRRWTLPGETDDISDFAASGLADEIADLRTGLAIARGIRLATGSGGDRLALAGYSHGAQVAYTYAGEEGGRPLAQRHVDAVAALDWRGGFAADEEAGRLAACDTAAAGYALIAEGYTADSNRFFINLGRGALATPDELWPAFGMTYREALYYIAGQTYDFAPYTPAYHLAAPVLDGDGAVLGFGESSEAAIARWFAGASAWQSVRESADFEAMLCGDDPPVDAPLANIATPLLYLGAAGGFGEAGLATLALTSSTDVTARIVQHQPAAGVLADFGHGDLLFAAAAPAEVWDPLARWLLAH